jgi:hypothetical protein
MLKPMLVAASLFIFTFPTELAYVRKIDEAAIVKACCKYKKYTK